MKKKGFTIIELMLAMAFLGTMLVGIASLTMRITNIYQKGLSLRNINSIGREIISDITRTTNGSRVNIDINPEVPTNGLVTQSDISLARAEYYIYTEEFENGDNLADGGRQMGGVFCTGDFSYIWNTADNLRKIRENGDDKVKDKNINSSNVNEILAKNVYVIHAKDGYVIPKLARFQDKEREACTHTEMTINGSVRYVPSQDKDIALKAKSAYLFDISAEGRKLDAVTELIEDNEADLALYDFKVFPATQHNATKQIFYSGMFILATYRGGVNIKSNGDFCQGSDNENGLRDSDITLNDFDYCAVNKFNFSARATGETGINKYGE
ncbi:MAG: prepilin-type N-terminal cleavage/methylation domain-containing protein [Candidatus Saccharibacteria bacterium]|nr:prepilin-type N-terminal cleavage/methylation domain-containing protein [Candidatus Saccharibacteria bacterium]